MKIVHRHFDRTQRGDMLMTPMIDVVFLLLIFFVCTAGFQIPEQSLPTSLLVSGAVETAQNPRLDPPLERVVVKFRTEEGSVVWLVNERPYATAAEVQRVLMALAQIDAAIPVVLDVAGEVPLGDVIDIYDACRLAGFDTVQFAASVDPTS